LDLFDLSHPDKEAFTNAELILQSVRLPFRVPSFREQEIPPFFFWTESFSRRDARL